MQRLDKFLALKDHPWYSRQVSKLNVEDVNLVKIWLSETSDLDEDQFSMACNQSVLTSNRFSLVDSLSKKKLLIVNELLMASRTPKPS